MSFNYHEPPTFNEWMRAVDRQVQARVGLSSDDLADCAYRDWYDDDMSATEAAELALENEGYEA
jgi:hypothetical protein